MMRNLERDQQWWQILPNYWEIIPKWRTLSKIRKWCFGGSLAFYLVAWSLLAYVDFFHHVVHLADGAWFFLLLGIGWPCILALLLFCNRLESKVHEGVNRRLRIKFLIIQLILIVTFNVSATVLSTKIKKGLGIGVSCCMLTSISLMEVGLMNDNDYGMAEMVVAILLGATSTMAASQLILIPVSLICCARKVAIFCLRESKSEDALPSSREITRHTLTKLETLNHEWGEAAIAIGYENNQSFANFTELGIHINTLKHNVKELVTKNATRDARGGDRQD